MPANLRPCPHCAHDRCHVVEAGDADLGYAVICDKCGARGPVDGSDDMAASKWNMRYGHEALTYILDQRVQ